MFLFREQNGQQICDIKLGNKSFESVATFRYLDTALTHQNHIPAVTLPLLPPSLKVVTHVKETTYTEGIQEQGVRIT